MKTFKNFIVLFMLQIMDLPLRCNSVPPYPPVVQNGNLQRDGLIEYYFHLGISYSEILMLLESLHGIYLSIRQLKRILRNRGLGRRINRPDPEDICRAIQLELRGSGTD